MSRIRAWWASRSPRQRAWLRWGGPMAGSAALAALDWLRYHRAGVAGMDEARQLLLRVGVALLLAAIVKLGFTRRWTFADIGIVWVLAGVAGLIIRVVVGRGPQPMAEWERDIIQAALDIGTLLLLIGLALLAPARLLGRGARDDREIAP